MLEHQKEVIEMFDVFSFHQQVDRLFNQMWSDLATRPTSVETPAFNVRGTGDSWKASVPLPGIDPKYVNLEVAGQSLTIRVDQPEDNENVAARFEHSITVPQFVDLEKVTATHRHGLLELTLPLKESVKPRRIQIEAAPADTKQLHA
jgi:HSP20 family protein